MYVCVVHSVKALWALLMQFHGMNIIFVWPRYSNEELSSVRLSPHLNGCRLVVCVPVVKEFANKIDHVPKLFNKAVPRQAAGFLCRLSKAFAKQVVPFFEVNPHGYASAWRGIP